MSRVILLDSGPLGMIAHPRMNPEVAVWLTGLLQAGMAVRVPEIADYEVRRELRRLNHLKSVTRLDALKSELGYVALTTATMLLAAEYWAQARQKGVPTSDDKALDGDVILAAQATLLTTNADDVIVATTNKRHLALFVPAMLWKDISASSL